MIPWRPKISSSSQAYVEREVIALCYLVEERHTFVIGMAVHIVCLSVDGRRLFFLQEKVGNRAPSSVFP